jgi:hypothetical protein
MDKGKCKGLVGPKGPQAAVRRSQAAVPFIVDRRSFIVHRDEMAVFKHKKRAVHDGLCLRVTVLLDSQGDE